MERKTENIAMDERLKDLPVREEKPGFEAEEMNLCTKCQRTNAPTRLKCFYCGAELEIGAAQSELLKPNLRRLEIWEKGFNLVLLPNSPKTGDENLTEISKTTKLEKDVLRKFLEMQKPLPLVRAETEKEAELVQKRLKEYGVETLVISDEKLAAEKPAKRLRGIEFFDDKLVFILFNNDEIVEISKEDLTLIVTGAIFQKRVEAVEKRGKKGENKTLQSSETASDEILIDVYSRQDDIGFRILGKGFDFSCLADEKGILAAENMKKLVGKLIETAPNAKLVDDYLRVRESLGNVWEVEHRTDSLGLNRESFGRFNLGNVTSADNFSQFTKYSRLHNYLR